MFSLSSFLPPYNFRQLFTRATTLWSCCLQLESSIFQATFSYLWHLEAARKKNCSLLFNERCSSSPCQQQCVTVTAWCHLASPSGDTRLSARICSPVLLPWHRRTGKWTWGPRNEPSGRLWATRRLRLIRVPQLVVFWCVGHSVFAPVDESEHYVHNYLSLALPSRSYKGQRLASPRFDIRRDCLCCVSLWHLGGGVKGAGGVQWCRSAFLRSCDCLNGLREGWGMGLTTAFWKLWAGAARLCFHARVVIADGLKAEGGTQPEECRSSLPDWLHQVALWSSTRILEHQSPRCRHCVITIICAK